MSYTKKVNVDCALWNYNGIVRYESLQSAQSIDFDLYVHKYAMLIDFQSFAAMKLMAYTMFRLPS